MSVELLNEVLKHFSGESFLFGSLCFVAGFFSAVAYYEKKTRAFRADTEKVEAEMKAELQKLEKQLKEQSHEDILRDVLNNSPFRK